MVRAFLDVPFQELVLHACEDAEVTFQLYHVLEQELDRRGLLEQYTRETLPLGVTLGKWEVDGVPVDASQLSDLRLDLLSSGRRSEKSRHRLCRCQLRP